MIDDELGDVHAEGPSGPSLVRNSRCNNRMSNPLGNTLD